MRKLTNSKLQMLHKSNHQGPVLTEWDRKYNKKTLLLNRNRSNDISKYILLLL